MAKCLPREGDVLADSRVRHGVEETNDGNCDDRWWREAGGHREGVRTDTVPQPASAFMAGREIECLSNCRPISRILNKRAEGES